MPRGADAADLLLERDAELAAIAAARADVLAGRGAAVLVCGPVGIGRTALLERAVADSGMASLTARGVELERGFAFGTALRLLRPAPGGEEPTAELGPGPLRELLLHGRAPTDEEHPTVVHGLVRLLAVRAARSPLLVAVDDLQACDEATVELLGALAQARPPGLLLLLAVRDGDGAPGPGSAMVAAVAGVRRLPLRPLGETAVAQLAGPQRAGGLHRHTGGNPLFLTELLRDGGTADAGAPASIVRLMARRLEGLSAQAREIAGALAVLNGSADPALLRHTSDLPAAAVQDGLTELARAGIADPQDCTFRHAVVRDAVLAGLPLPRRAALHVRAARLLGESRPRVAAAHLVQADAHEDARSAWAADVLLRAAGEAGAGSDERRRCLQRALACAIDPPTRSRARAALGLVLAQHHDPEGVTELEHARELARAGRPAAEVAVELAEALFHLARMEDSARTCREALATLDAADDTHRELRLRLEAGALAAEAAGGTVRRPAVPAELRDGPARTLGERAVLSRLAWTLATMGTVPAAEVRALARRAMDGTRLLDDAGPSSPAFVYAASALVIAGDPSTVVALTTEAARRAHAAHAPVGVTYALALRGQAHVAQERLLAAAADAQTALDGLHAADLPAQAVAMAWRLETAIDLDDARGAAEDLRAAALEGELPDLGPVHSSCWRGPGSTRRRVRTTGRSVTWCSCATGWGRGTRTRPPCAGSLGSPRCSSGAANAPRHATRSSRRWRERSPSGSPGRWGSAFGCAGSCAVAPTGRTTCAGRPRSSGRGRRRSNWRARCWISARRDTPSGTRRAGPCCGRRSRRRTAPAPPPSWTTRCGACARRAPGPAGHAYRARTRSARSGAW